MSLEDGPRLAMRVLNGTAALVILALVLGVVLAPKAEAPHDDFSGLAQLFMVVMAFYYGLALLVGWGALKRGNAAWGWHLVALRLLLILGPLALFIRTAV